MQQPETKFVSVGSARVAYQVFGDGPLDLLHLRASGASIDSVWEHPGHLRIWRSSLGLGRTIIIDPRGTGVSDALPESQVGDLDLYIADILAVLDAVGAARVSVTGEYEGAVAAVKFAAEHPDRVDKLALMNGYACGAAARGVPDAQQDAVAAWVRTHWGTGEVIATASPHLAEDRSFCARMERVGMRPSAAAAMIRKNAEHDIRALLPKITAPTIVVYTGDLAMVTRAQSQELAESIPGARLIESPSSSFYWGGGFADSFVEFFSGAGVASQRELLTVVMTDVVDSTRAVAAAGDSEWRRTLDFLDDLVASRVKSIGGRVVKQTGDGHLLTFARPSDAVRAAVALCQAAPTLGVQLRAGVHTGEVERREDGDLGGLTVHVASRIAALAGPDEVVVSRTVVELLGASEYAFSERGEHELKGVPGNWALFAVEGA